MFFAKLALVFTSALALTPNQAQVSAIVEGLLKTKTKQINDMIESKLPADLVFDTPIGVNKDRTTSFWHVHKGYSAQLTEASNLNSLSLEFNDATVTSTEAKLTVALNVGGSFAKAPRLSGSVEAHYGGLNAGGDIEFDVKDLAFTIDIEVTLFLADPSAVSVKAHLDTIKFARFDIENINAKWEIGHHYFPSWFNSFLDKPINSTVDLVEEIAPQLEDNIVKMLNKYYNVKANGELDHFAPLAFQILFAATNTYLSE